MSSHLASTALLLSLVACAPAVAASAAAADGSCIQTLTSIHGGHASGRFGSAVDASGDFNGDGFDDLLVGAEGEGTGGSAHLIFGGPGTHGLDPLVFVGDAASARFGAAVGWAGDVNGDGFDDLLIGDPERRYGSNDGDVALYLGGANPDAIEDRRFRPLGPNQFRLGLAMTGTDFNADGFNDVVLGASGPGGSAFVYFGGPTMDEYYDLRLHLGYQAMGFGQSVASLGDFDGDGFDDVAVGAPNTLNPYQSRVHLFFGGPSPDASVDVTLSPPTAAEAFGAEVAGAGDVDGDGRHDLLVGATGSSGYVNLYLGTPASTVPVARVHAGAPGAYLDLSLAGGADVDGDGRPDYLIGAPGSGSLYGAPGTLEVHSYVAGELCRITGAPGERFAHSVSISPHYLGAGPPALFSGAPWNDVAAADAGRVWMGAYAGEPVPVLLSLVRIEWEVDRVVVVWRTPSSSAGRFRIERSAGEDPWALLTEVEADGLGTIRVADADVQPGHRYGYRVAQWGAGSVAHGPAAWIEVPDRPELVLRGFEPNPARGTPVVEFALMADAPVRLEVFDVTGRMRFGRELTMTGAGPHRVVLDALAGAEPGVYVVRLTHEGVTRRVLGTIIR